MLGEIWFPFLSKNSIAPLLFNIVNSSSCSGLQLTLRTSSELSVVGCGWIALRELLSGLQTVTSSFVLKNAKFFPSGLHFNCPIEDARSTYPFVSYLRRRLIPLRPGALFVVAEGL